MKKKARTLRTARRRGGKRMHLPIIPVVRALSYALRPVFKNPSRREVYEEHQIGRHKAN